MVRDVYNYSKSLNEMPHYRLHHTFALALVSPYTYPCKISCATRNSLLQHTNLVMTSLPPVVCYMCEPALWTDISNSLGAETLKAYNTFSETPNSARLQAEGI